MNHSWLFVALLAALAAPASAAEKLTFASGGEVVLEATVEQLRERVPVTTLKVFEPHSETVRPYRVLAFNALLQAVFGPSWKQASAVRVVAKDGYAPLIPAKLLQSHSAYLAFGAEDTADFVLVDEAQGNTLTDLSPAYLVWDNIDSPEMRAEGDWCWPYQAISFTLESEDVSKRAEPPGGASEEARRGHELYKTHCMPCHAMDGAGGIKSVDLLSPVPVTRYIDAEFLERIIVDPLSVRANATMPAWAGDPDGRDLDVRAILAYLSTMAEAASRPETSTATGAR